MPRPGGSAMSLRPAQSQALRSLQENHDLLCRGRIAEVPSMGALGRKVLSGPEGGRISRRPVR